MTEIIDLTKNLVQFKTMHSRPDEIHRCAAFIERYLNALDVKYQRLDYHKTPSILVLPRKGIAPLLFMSHFDVVDAPDELFKPVIKNGRLYGRGCFDDKYAVALSLVLLKNTLNKLRKQGKGQKELPFGILMTGDEETGGFNGAKKTLIDIQADFCIVLDGGNIEKIVVKESGVVRIKLMCRVTEDSGRGSGRREDAVEKLRNDMNTLENYFVASAPKSPYRSIVRNPVRFETSHNRVPKFAEVNLDIGYTASDDLEKMFDHMQKVMYSDIVVKNVEPLFPGGESEHLKLLLKLSKKTKIGFEDGANDSRFLSQFGIKGIVWGADGNRSQHTPDEHVDIESVYDLYKLLCAFIKQCESLARTC